MHERVALRHEKNGPCGHGPFIASANDRRRRRWRRSRRRRRTIIRRLCQRRRCIIRLLRRRLRLRRRALLRGQTAGHRPFGIHAQRVAVVVAALHVIAGSRSRGYSKRLAILTPKPCCPHSHASTLRTKRAPSGFCSRARCRARPTLHPGAVFVPAAGRRKPFARRNHQRCSQTVQAIRWRVTFRSN